MAISVSYTTSFNHLVNKYLIFKVLTVCSLFKLNKLAYNKKGVEYNIPNTFFVMRNLKLFSSY